MPELGSHEIYRAVLDSLPVAVCAVNRDGKVILWNEGAERVTGYLRQDVLGRMCYGTDSWSTRTRRTIPWMATRCRCWRRCATGAA